MSNETGRAVVTGSSSGIGLAVVRRLLADGWQVCGFDLAPPAIEHASFEAVTADLTDGAALAAAVRRACQVQALVHAAGILRPAPLGRLDSADGQAMWRLHVQAATELANLVLPAMVQAGHGLVAAAYLVGSLVAGLVAVGFGVTLGERVFGRRP